MFFLLYKHTDDGVFDDFPKFSDHFPKISEFKEVIQVQSENFTTHQKKKRSNFSLTFHWV